MIDLKHIAQNKSEPTEKKGLKLTRVLDIKRRYEEVKRLLKGYPSNDSSKAVIKLTRELLSLVDLEQAAEFPESEMRNFPDCTQKDLKEWKAECRLNRNYSSNLSSTSKYRKLTVKVECNKQEEFLHFTDLPTQTSVKDLVDSIKYRISNKKCGIKKQVERSTITVFYRKQVMALSNSLISYKIVDNSTLRAITVPPKFKLQEVVKVNPNYIRREEAGKKGVVESVTTRDNIFLYKIRCNPTHAMVVQEQHLQAEKGTAARANTQSKK